ncbi:hypothetical protein DRQ20_00590 [bacterium]|nr:MAG: hypothetical protein DRQ20_00590 [bacterium]
MPRVLLIEDHEGLRESLELNFKQKGWDVVSTSSGEEALKLLEEEKVDVAVIDKKLPDISGISLIERVRAFDDIPVIIITAYGNVEDAVNAMKKGAWDFIEKPFEPEFLINRVERALREVSLRKKKEIEEEPEIVGRSPSIVKAKELALKVAPADTTVLLLGESGTGKELFAHLIHKRSKRRDGPFVIIKCAAIPETLLESELFGIEKGTATGVEGRVGKFEVADGGTVFLDEIGDLPLPLQAKLLRVIEEKSFERVGGRRRIKVDVRIIAATNKDLEEEIKKGNFREDLYFRISTFPIHIPPLRERREDIPVLAEHFLKKYSAAMRKKIKGIRREAMKILMEYPWPGNVRELENVIERAVILAEGNYIEKEEIILPAGERKEEIIPLKELIKKVEREAILHAIELCGGDKEKAAEMLGITLRTLYNKLKEVEDGS